MGLQYMKPNGRGNSKCLSEILSLGLMSSVRLVFLFICGIFYNVTIHSGNKAPNARMTSLL
jgi:hypothetical protein